MQHHHKLLSSLFTILICFTFLGFSSQALAQSDPNIKVFSPYYSEMYETREDGTKITISIINGPPQPLPEFEEERLASMRDENSAQGIIPNFPSYSWVFGCSAVSQAMISAYYDRNGFANLYTGPTNGGVAPLTDTSWPIWTDSVGKDYPSNPLIASRNGTDGRTTRGSIENYWVSYGSQAPDPYITNGWPEHTFAEAVGDFMYTSQSKHSNNDGSTSFYNYDGIPDKLTCEDMVSYGYSDGTLGRKTYYESRGYQVTECYNQLTDNKVAGGFSLAQFKQEIDAGRPVFISLVGHSVVGYGYDGNTIYIRDTWISDPNERPTMQWGGFYQGMEMRSIGMVKLAKNITPPKPNQMSFPMIIKNKPPAPQPIQNWNFEQGPAHWNEYSSNGYSIIGTDLPGNLKPTSGKYVAWLGGADNEISQISQTFFIPPDYQDLAFNYFFASKDECGNDYFFVKFNGAEVGYANLCTSNNSSQWATARYSMKAYQGQTVQLTFEVTTNDSNNSNALIDDVRMLLVGTQMSNEEDFLYEPIAPGDLFEIKSRPN